MNNQLFIIYHIFTYQILLIVYWRFIEYSELIPEQIQTIELDFPHTTHRNQQFSMFLFNNIEQFHAKTHGQALIESQVLHVGPEGFANLFIGPFQRAIPEAVARNNTQTNAALFRTSWETKVLRDNFEYRRGIYPNFVCCDWVLNSFRDWKFLDVPRVFSWCDSGITYFGCVYMISWVSVKI